MDLELFDDVYDSDILLIEPVINRINQRHAFTIGDFDAFREEVINRFGEAGFVADVVWDQVYEFQATEVREPIIRVLGRVKKEEFDYDRQVHEVTHDILEIDEPGVISESGELKSIDRPVGFSDVKDS